MNNIEQQYCAAVFSLIKKGLLPNSVTPDDVNEIAMILPKGPEMDAISKYNRMNINKLTSN